MPELSRDFAVRVAACSAFDASPLKTFVNREDLQNKECVCHTVMELLGRQAPLDVPHWICKGLHTSAAC